MKRLLPDSTPHERDLLARVVATPPDELRGVLKALPAADLYLVQTVVGNAVERHIERDVQIQREVAGVVRWRFPRGWPSPGSSVMHDSTPDTSRA